MSSAMAAATAFSGRVISAAAVPAWMGRWLAHTVIVHHQNAPDDDAIGDGQPFEDQLGLFSAGVLFDRRRRGRLGCRG
jgi:hypothetical protein